MSKKIKVPLVINELLSFGITPKEVAETCNVSEATIRNLCKAGKIPAMRIGKQWRIRNDYAATLMGHMVELPASEPAK